MSGMDPRLLMWLGFGLLAAAGVLLGTVVVSRRKELPMSRRRPDVPPPPSILSRASTAATETVGRLMAGRSATMDEMLYLAGIRTPARDVVVVLIVGAFVAFIIGLVLVNWFLGLLLALLVPVAFRLVVTVRTDRRRSAFGGQLSEILQTLAANLRAGNSLPQAMNVLAGEAEEPVRGEFARVGNELRVGRSMNLALDAVADRMKSEDFRWVTQAIAINREVGGNLADVLDGVAHTMRERAALRRQVDALSAEGKMSGWVLMALPVAVFLLVSMANPGYFEPLLTKPAGWVMIGLSLVLMVIGGFWLNAVTKIKY